MGQFIGYDNTTSPRSQASSNSQLKAPGYIQGCLHRPHTPAKRAPPPPSRSSKLSDAPPTASLTPLLLRPVLPSPVFATWKVSRIFLTYISKSGGCEVLAFKESSHKDLAINFIMILINVKVILGNNFHPPGQWELYRR